MSSASETMSPIEAASRRLGQALDGLESVVSRRLNATKEVEKLQIDIQTLSLDRSKLAQELDRVQAANAGLLSAQKDVETRIDGAMEAIRDALSDSDAG